MEKLLLVRHAVTDWHGQNRNLGQNDIPLNEEGVRQAEAVAAALAQQSIAAIACSPLRRAAHTAEIAARPHHHLEVAVDERLTDFRIGVWEGKSHDELAARDDYRRFVADPTSVEIPGGESLEGLRARALAAVEERRRTLGGEGAIAIVSHADVVRVLLAHYLGMSVGHFARFRISVASITTIAFPPERPPVVLLVNWTPSPSLL